MARPSTNYFSFVPTTPRRPPVTDTRAAVCARLGVAADASNATIFAALDARIAAKHKPAAATAQRLPGADASADAELYERAFGGARDAATQLSPADAALYELAFGKER